MDTTRTEDPAETYERALALAEKGNLEDALRLYKNLLVLPDVPRGIRAQVYNDLGVINFAMGDVVAAERMLTKAICVDAFSKEAYRNLIDVYGKRVQKEYRFSTVISTFNRFPELKKCMESIRENSYFPVEIVVVCDPCQDGSIEFLLEQKERGDVVAIINEDRIGHAKSHNKGVRVAGGNYVAYVNDDVEVMPGWDLSIVATIDDDETAGCGVPLVVYPDGRVQSPGQYNPYRSVYFDWIGQVPLIDSSGVVGQFLEGSPEFHVARECDYGYFPVMKRGCFKEVGLYDEQFKHYFIDPDQGYRIQQIGMKNIYCPTSVFVHHEASKKDPELVKKRAEADMEKFVKKWGLFNYMT
jgi:GT2 family glycosyltransferase